MEDTVESIAYEAWYQPFGFRLRLLSNSQHIIEAAEVSFGRFGHVPPGDGPDFTFTFFERGQGNSITGQPEFYHAGPIARQDMGEQAGLTINRQTGAAEGFFSPAVVTDRPFFRWYFLDLSFYWMLASRGVMGLHGAALVKDGRAVLLRAQSGGGKTTLAYAGARQRFQALAEDVVWIDLRRGLWRGAPWTFHLLPDARTLFPELAGYEPLLQTNGELKLEVDLETIRPGSAVTSARPGRVVLVERLAGGRSRLEPLNLAAAKTFWRQGVTGTETAFPDYEGHIDDLLRDNTYHLYFGDDIDGGVSLLETLFA
jgi:hypothetical protein